MKSDLDPGLALDVAALTEKLAAKHPEILTVMDDAKAGVISPEEALSKMAWILEGRDHESPSPILWDAGAASIEETVGDLFDNGVGRPQLNPLVQAALLERIQYDGDVPEHRTSDLPVGVKPAVPVKTTTKSAVALGLMLDQASEQVESQVRQAQKDRALLLEGLASGKTSLSDLVSKGATWLAQVEGDPDFTALADGSQETDVAAYRRGEVPSAVSVPTPSGSALAALTPEQMREAAFKFLSTTQGRRSAVQVIREIVAVRLRGGSFEVIERDFDPDRDVQIHAYHEWAVNVHGKGSVKETFNLVDTAGQALASGLLRDLGDAQEPTLYLEVVPKDTVDVRSVGWSARLVV